MSVSDAFLRGKDIAEVLHAGDWSGAQTFYRHYTFGRPTVPIDPVSYSAAFGELTLTRPRGGEDRGGRGGAAFLLFLLPLAYHVPWARLWP